MRNLFIIVSGLALLGTPATSRTPAISESPIGVRVTVTPKWQDPLQHPTYPPPSGYRVTALITVAGTNKAFAQPHVEIAAGGSGSSETAVGDCVVKLTASIDSTRERAFVRVRGYRQSTLLFESQVDVYLAAPPSLK